MKSSDRVVINTGFLYGKMLITMFISLYSTRLILSALGATDYGIFNLVAGVIAMLSFLNAAMTISTQRYLSFYLGAGESERLKSIFNTSVILHFIIGLIIVILLELVGIYLINRVLDIPTERIHTAKIVFHFMVVSTFFTINAVPYDASINAHENMLFDALTGIFESLMKLLIAIWLVYTAIDKLILYGALIAGLTILIRIIKGFYCSMKYKECNLSLTSHIRFDLFKELFSFAGWNLYGSFCIVIRNQGLAIVLNFFFGVLINAAYGIANQVNGILSSFSSNMLKALNPQIMKNEGSGNRDRMLKLAIVGCKSSFFLLAFLSIPIIIEMPFILNLWLKEVPENAAIFCQLVLLITLVQQLTVGIMTAIQSAGRIKTYQIVLGSIILLNIPAAFTLIKLGLPAYSILIGTIFIEFIAGGARILFAKKLVGLSSKLFLKDVIFNSLLAVCLAAFVSIIPRVVLPESLFRLLVTVLSSSTAIIFFGKYIALTKYEVENIEGFLKLSFHKIFPRPNN